MRAWAHRWQVKAARARGRLAGIVRRHLPFESQHLFGLTVGVGIVCGFVAVLFHLAIRAAESLMI